MAEQHQFGDFSEHLELTILMPCLNEALTIGKCIEKAKAFLVDFNILGEILIADNGSTDGSQEISKKHGARVIAVKQKGYGSALRGGISAAKGKFIIMGDADESYDFYNLMPLLDKLREGYDLVMGNRFTGGIEPGAMPPLHKYLGNPVLSGMGRLFFKTAVKDFHCGLRGFSKKAVLKMDLQTSGMEFASEMVVKSSLLKMKICEVPTTLSPDGRDRPPHLRSWRDGWRHLRFLLLYSPRWLFLYPGMILFSLGILFSIWALISPITINNISFDIHSLAYFNAAIVVGFNLVLFAIQSRIFGYRAGLLPKHSSFDKLFKYFNLERGLFIGTVMIITGILLAIWAVAIWARVDFGGIDPRSTMRIVLPSFSIIIMGTQVVFSSFFLSIIGICTAKLKSMDISNYD